MPRFGQAWVQLGHQNHDAPAAGAAKGGPGVVSFLGSRGWSGAEGRLVVQGVRQRAVRDKLGYQSKWINGNKSELKSVQGCVQGRQGQDQGGQPGNHWKVLHAE